MSVETLEGLGRGRGTEGDSILIAGLVNGITNRMGYIRRQKDVETYIGLVVLDDLGRGRGFTDTGLEDMLKSREVYSVLTKVGRI
jgi:hypothetical protein